MLRPGQLWGLRLAGLGLVLVVAAVIGGIVLFADDEDSEPVEPLSGGATAEELQELSDRILTESYDDKAAGLSFSYPENWKLAGERGIINLKSADDCAVMTFTVAGTASQSRGVMVDLLRRLGRSYPGSAARHDTSAPQVGGRPTQRAIVAVRSKEGATAPVAINVSRGVKLTHVVETVIREANCESAIIARAILESIAYVR